MSLSTLSPFPPRMRPRRAAPDRAWSAPLEACTEPASAAEFEALVRPYLPRMLRAAKSVLGSEDLAWDAVQETLMRLWTRGWLPEEPLSTLVQLTIKSSLHQRRCLRRRVNHESQSREPEHCCHEDPLAELESADQVRAVRQAVASLTQDLRAVLELYEFEGHSYEAIARRLDVPIGTVRSRLSRGRAQLKARLEADDDAA